MKRLFILCFGIFLCQTITPGNICGKTTVFEIPAADNEMATADAQEQAPKSQADSEPDDLVREYMNQPLVREVPDADKPEGVVEIDPPIRPERPESPISKLLELTIDPILPLKRDEQIESGEAFQRTPHPFGVTFEEDDDDESPRLGFPGTVAPLSNPLASPTESLSSLSESSPIGYTISPSGMVHPRRQSVVYTAAGSSPSPLDLSPGTPPDPSQVCFRNKEECISVEPDLRVPSYFTGGEKGSMHAIRLAHKLKENNKEYNMPIPKEVPVILTTFKRGSVSEGIQDPQKILKSKLEGLIARKAEQNESLAKALEKRKAIQDEKMIFKQLRQQALEFKKYKSVEEQLAKDVLAAKKKKEEEQLRILEKIKERPLEIVRTRLERDQELTLGPVHIISKL
ncbi:MAG TPA: hypothetical protein VFF04_02400 [Candidatus Babeliales bacterium]|nr:hypothetical protein [Candidatus Babeliales bacterium]